MKTLEEDNMPKYLDVDTSNSTLNRKSLELALLTGSRQHFTLGYYATDQGDDGKMWGRQRVGLSSGRGGNGLRGDPPYLLWSSVTS